MNSSENEIEKKLLEEIQRTTEFLELLKIHFRQLYIIRYITVYIAVLITIAVVWFVWYT